MLGDGRIAPSEYVSARNIAIDYGTVVIVNSSANGPNDSLVIQFYGNPDPIPVERALNLTRHLRDRIMIDVEPL